eukprot:CAMPEP_0197900124 /NCGR_PEP_ID=MMETSP1439-20131203/48348_1 /TAXON_ID=66791 /ORGANISM="Gonyaulax spinifera, Strain CCMP409" /LENGTH=107 /DNA_ID=CAMNT_0043520987 /DNA_START=68 /DNA_END=391 /DNA_ORIENTATION=+
MAAARNAGSLLTLALLACAAFVLLPSLQCESFVAPRTPQQAGREGPSALAQGYQLEQRAPGVAAAAGAPEAPGKINLLFLAVLVGTAVVGLIALFAYGAYSGAGSSI